MIEFHVITVRGSVLVGHIVDGKLVIPAENPPLPVPELPNPA